MNAAPLQLIVSKSIQTLGRSRPSVIGSSPGAISGSVCLPDLQVPEYPHGDPAQETGTRLASRERALHRSHGSFGRRVIVIRMRGGPTTSPARGGEQRCVTGTEPLSFPTMQR